MTRRRGVTLLEMIAVVAVLAVVAASVMPLVADASGTRLVAAETLLRDDLEQARHRTIADPSRPIMLLLDADGRGWRLVPEGNRTPIARIDGSDWTVRFGEHAAEGLDGVVVTRLDAPDERGLRFDATGVAMASTPPRFELAVADRRRALEVGLVTGLVQAVPSD